VKLPIQKIGPEQIPTPRVGIGQERLIGRAVVIWARLEANLHDLIWTIRGKGLNPPGGSSSRRLFLTPASAESDGCPAREE
jgi:hypothetical protein